MRLSPYERKSYIILSPKATHHKEVGCKEYGCLNYQNGWASKVDERTSLGKTQAGYIRSKSGRHFTERKLESGETLFLFRPEQECFATHTVPLGREEICVKRNGDTRQWDGDPQRLSTRAWLDDFGEHQERLADLARREHG